MSSTFAQDQKVYTPILDRISALPRARTGGLPTHGPSVIFSLAIFFCVCLFASGRAEFLDSIGPWIDQNVQVLSHGSWVAPRLILTAFGVVLAWFVAILLHELGHLLAGTAMGFRFRYLQVKSLRIDHCLRISRRSSDRRLGAVSFFPDQMKNCPWRCAFTTFGGPLSNLIIGIFALELPIHKSFPVGVFMGSSIFLGVWNLSPWHPDGKNLLNAIFRRRRHEARIAISQLIQQLEAGVDPENLDPRLIAEAEILRERSILTVAANAMAFARNYATHEYDAAAVSLEVCLAFAPWSSGLMRQTLICDAVILQAKRGFIESANAWYGDIPPNTKLRFRMEAEAAILEAGGEVEAALQRIRDCESLLLKEPSTQLRESGLRQLRKWQAELEQRVEVGPTDRALF